MERIIPTDNICRVCSAEMMILEKITDMPINVSVLFNKPVKSHNVISSLYSCPVCGHFQIPDVNDHEYYSEYLMASLERTGESKIDIDRKTSIAYLSSLAHTHKQVLDIGCGIGAMFPLLEKHFENIIGVEPSKKEFTYAEKRGHTVLNSYFHKGLFLGNDFDAFCSFQVFEHVGNPLEILKDVYSVLKPGGVGLIEVPNGSAIINELQYHSIFSDHLNYYSPDSLAMLARLSGFQIICIRSSLGDYHLEMFIRKPACNQSIMNNKKRQCDIILSVCSQYSNIVVWGAGAKSYVLLGSLEDKLNISNIVDIDVCKHGLYIPGTEVPVEAPSEDIFSKADIVIICSIPYKEEIVRELHEHFHYRKQILCLSDI